MSGNDSDPSATPGPEDQRQGRDLAGHNSNRRSSRRRTRRRAAGEVAASPSGVQGNVCPPCGECWYRNQTSHRKREKKKKILINSGDSSTSRDVALLLSSSTMWTKCCSDTTQPEGELYSGLISQSMNEKQSFLEKVLHFLLVVSKRDEPLLVCQELPLVSV